MTTKKEEIHCPICDSANVERATGKQTITDRDGQEFVLTAYQYSVCQECECEFITDKQSRTNDLLLADAKRRASDMLSSGEIRAIRKKYGLSQQDASVVFGGGRNAFSKYERGNVTQSLSMDRLLRVVGEFPEVMPYLSSLASVKVIPATQPRFVVYVTSAWEKSECSEILSEKLCKAFKGTRGSNDESRRPESKKVVPLTRQSSAKGRWVDDSMRSNG